MEDAARAKGNSIFGVSGFTCPTNFVLQNGRLQMFLK